MSRFAHHNPEGHEAVMEALVDRADFAKTQRREREQSGELPPLMDQIVAICRAGHERATTQARQNGCPLAIRLWADQPVSYSTWREGARDRADCERDRGPGKW